MTSGHVIDVDREALNADTVYEHELCFNMLATLKKCEENFSNLTTL